MAKKLKVYRAPPIPNQAQQPVVMPASTKFGGPLMAAVLDRFYGTGRRKTSVARVWIRPGRRAHLCQRTRVRGLLPA